MNISEVFDNICNTKFINTINNKKLRCKQFGIDIKNAIQYRFKYCDINSTKQDITNEININNNNNFNRQAYDQKEANISVQVYEKLLKEIINLYETEYSFKNIINKSGPYKYIAVDGTYTNNRNHKEVLNLGFYDITKNIPIELISYNNKKNGEVKQTINYISNNIDKFNKNTVFVMDRCYYSYELLNFLCENQFNFIIRMKGNGNTFNKNKINDKFKNEINVIKHDYEFKKIILVGKGKKDSKKAIINTKNNTVFVTNIKCNNELSKKQIIEMYKLRWNIETYFKYVKNNFKFQHSNEKEKSNSLRKNYCCDMIITYLTKIIELHYWNINKKNIKNKKEKTCTRKLNYTLLTTGIFNHLLNYIFNKSLTNDKFKNFCNIYCKIIINEKDRSFPRHSKTPFSKWYIKSYSELSKYEQIKQAIDENDIDSLNKNLKLITNNIISIKII